MTQESISSSVKESIGKPAAMAMRASMSRSRERRRAEEGGLPRRRIAAERGGGGS